MTGVRTAMSSSSVRKNWSSRSTNLCAKISPRRGGDVTLPSFPTHPPQPSVPPPRRWRLRSLSHTSRFFWGGGCHAMRQTVFRSRTSGQELQALTAAGAAAAAAAAATSAATAAAAVAAAAAETSIIRQTPGGAGGGVTLWGWEGRGALWLRMCGGRGAQ